MSEYVRELMTLTDADLAARLSGPLPGSTNHELIKFEMQRRAMVAQTRAADAAERYTRATYVFIMITAIAAMMSAGVSLFK